MADAPQLATPFEAQFHAGRMQEWVICRLIRQIHTATLVKVVAVYPTAGTVGFVDVRPLVQQQTTAGVLIDTAPMYRLPYLRMQGGPSAIILDPAVDDLGLAVFAERDITTVASTRQEGPPATDRAYDAGDGLYLGGFLNADPTQYVQFLPDGGIDVVSTGQVNVTAAQSLTITAPDLTVHGPTNFSDPITAPEATIGGIAFTTHKHTSANSGSPTSSPIP